MCLYIKTSILRGYGIFKNDFAHPREPAIVPVKAEVVRGPGALTSPGHHCGSHLALQSTLRRKYIEFVNKNIIKIVKIII